MFTFEGISIRVVEERDLELLRSLRNDPTTWTQLTTAKLITAEQQKAWYLNMSMAPDKRYFTIFDGEHDFIGVVRCDEIDQSNRSIRVGCDIVPELRRRGYGTRTYRLLLKYCFDFFNMHRVWLLVLDLNDAGLSLYRKTGFREEGKLREAIFRDGAYRDYIIMGILESEYRQNSKRSG